MASNYPIYDPLGIEIFAIDETFESVFNGLRGVYFRLYYKESLRPPEKRDAVRQQSFFSRYKDLRKLKVSYKYNDWLNKRDATKILGDELKEMIFIELNYYKTL